MNRKARVSYSARRLRETRMRPSAFVTRLGGRRFDAEPYYISLITDHLARVNGHHLTFYRPLLLIRVNDKKNIIISRFLTELVVYFYYLQSSGNLE